MEEMGGSVRYEARERGSLFVLKFRGAAAGAEGKEELEGSLRVQLSPYLLRLATVPIYKISAINAILQEMNADHPESVAVANLTRRVRELAMAGDAEGVRELVRVD